MLKLLLTCEHGGNQVPEKYTSLFEGSEELLRSHRGWDPGALDLYFDLLPMAAESLYSETSRLLIELNRSEHHPKLYSAITRPLPASEKESIKQVYYHPYRQKVEELVSKLLSDGSKVLHLSVHSFTPVLDGEIRNADIGLLYDPARQGEREFCLRWQQELQRLGSHLKVRLNYPYLGKADGLTTYLRKKFSADKYAGVELEVNQKYPLDQPENWQQLKESIKSSLSVVLQDKN